MLSIMSQAANAIEAYNEALTAVQANIANMETPGYKTIGVSFQSVFDRVMRTGTAASSGDNLGGTNPYQIGQGMSAAGSTIDFTQGTFNAGGNLDLAITGQGFFIVSPDGGTTPLYTKNGQFKVVNGNLVTSSGMQVYGFNTASGKTLVPISGLDYFDSTQLTFTSAGKLMEGTTRDTGFSIALTYFKNPTALAQAQGTTFAETLGSGSAQDPVDPVGLAGTITPKTFEGSNAVYITESLKAAELEKALNANLSMVKMASDVISSFISKLS